MSRAVWQISGGPTSRSYAEVFLKHGVALSPGAQFGAPGFVRLNFGTQRATLSAALQRMKTATKAKN